MKKLSVLFVFALAAGSACAAPAWTDQCRDAAYAKLQGQADSYGIEVDMSTLRLTGSSTSWLANYAWWTVDVTDLRNRPDLRGFLPKEGDKLVLQKLTQKPLFRPCF